MKTDAKHTALLKDLANLPDDTRVNAHITATVLGCAVSTIWNLAKSGKIPRPTRVGRTTRWRLGDLRRIVRGEAQ